MAKIIIGFIVGGVFSLMALTLYWANSGEKKLEFVKIEKIYRVLMHTSNDYSFLVAHEPNVYVLKRVCVHGRGKVTFFADVKPDEVMWAEAGKSRSDIFTEVLNVHIHSSADVNGAGWNHGKGGEGTTTVIE